MARRSEEFDEDEDDELPQRRSKRKATPKSNTTMILTIVGVSVLLVIGACAGMGWYVVKSTKKAFDEASGSFKSIDEGEAFLDKLTTDQVQAAYDSTTPDFKASMSREQFLKLLEKHPLLKEHDSARQLSDSAPTGQAPNRRAVISFELTQFDSENDPDEFDPPVRKPKPKKAGPKALTVTITLAEQSNGVWKVDRLTVP